MMERIKSALLGLLVVLSLGQSYFLAYSMPSMEAKVKTDQDYVKTEQLGPEEKVKNLLFPEELVVHMGGDKHTVFYPNDTFYSMVLSKLQMREFKNFQRRAADLIDWEQVRREDEGIEIRFGRAVPFELLRREKVFKVDTDFLYSGDSISRIWIFARSDSGEVRSFFFSADGTSVYESTGADLTVQDVEQSVGFGRPWTPFVYWANGVYLPQNSLSESKFTVGFTKYTPDQLTRNLFIDPVRTRMIQDSKDGSQIYQDGKRGLKVEQGGGWLTYKDPITPSEVHNDLSENITSAVQFVNQHGGWSGSFRLVKAPDAEGDADATIIRFQQYYRKVPIVSSDDFRFGHMQLTVQEGTISSYERSLLVLKDQPATNETRTLVYGDQLLTMIRNAAKGQAVASIYPAFKSSHQEDQVVLEPVWAIRMESGEVRYAE